MPIIFTFSIDSPPKAEPTIDKIKKKNELPREAEFCLRNCFSIAQIQLHIISYQIIINYNI